MSLSAAARRDRPASETDRLPRTLPFPLAEMPAMRANPLLLNAMPAPSVHLPSPASAMRADVSADPAALSAPISTAAPQPADVPAIPVAASTTHVSAGILTIELRSRLLRRVHYDQVKRHLGVVLQNGRLIVHPDVPAIVADMIGRHPSPGHFYKETLKGLLQTPLAGMSRAALGFRWRLRGVAGVGVRT